MYLGRSILEKVYFVLLKSIFQKESKQTQFLKLFQKSECFQTTISDLGQYVNGADKPLCMREFFFYKYTNTQIQIHNMWIRDSRWEYGPGVGVILSNFSATNFAHKIESFLFTYFCVSFEFFYRSDPSPDQIWDH